MTTWEFSLVVLRKRSLIKNWLLYKSPWLCYQDFSRGDSKNFLILTFINLLFLCKMINNSSTARYYPKKTKKGYKKGLRKVSKSLWRTKEKKRRLRLQLIGKSSWTRKTKLVECRIDYRKRGWTFHNNFPSA